MNPLAVAVPAGAAAAYYLWERDKRKHGVVPTTPSGVPLENLPETPLAPGAAAHLPAGNYPAPIQATYANAWTQATPGATQAAAANLRSLGYLDLAVALENRIADQTPTVAAGFFGRGLFMPKGILPKGKRRGRRRAIPRWFSKVQRSPRARRKALLVAKLRANPQLMRRIILKNPRLMARFQKRKLRLKLVRAFRRNPALVARLRANPALVAKLRANIHRPQKIQTTVSVPTDANRLRVKNLMMRKLRENPKFRAKLAQNPVAARALFKRLAASAVQKG